MQALQEQLGRLADGLEGAQASVSDAFAGIASQFPGPALNSTLDGIRQQVRVMVPVLRL